MVFPARVWTMADYDRVHTNEWTLASYSCETRTNSLKCGILHILGSCAVDTVAAILATASAGEPDYNAPDCLVSSLYTFAVLAVISVPERQTRN